MTVFLFLFGNKSCMCVFVCVYGLGGGEGTGVLRVSVCVFVCEDRCHVFFSPFIITSTSAACSKRKGKIKIAKYMIYG